jgi:hypothetical protein
MSGLLASIVLIVGFLVVGAVVTAIAGAIIIFVNRRETGR